METNLETLDDLLKRYAGDNDLPREVARIRFEDAVREGDDPLHVIPYLANIGIQVDSLDDLLKINNDQNEEEISCFRVVEGVAVCIASDGLWQLFEAAKP